MVRRRAYNDPYYETLEYMQYIDYGLQLLPTQSDILIRKGFSIDSFQDKKKTYGEVQTLLITGHFYFFGR